MSAWAEKNLSEVITLQRGHDLPATIRGKGEVPVVGSFGVTGYHDVAKYSGPGVTIGRSGASIGVATYIETDYWPLNTALFVKDFKKNDPRWVYYLLDSIDFTAYNSGSAQPSLNRNYLAAIGLKLPPLREQRAIADTLGALDDKIESNRRAISILSELFNCLFAQTVSTTDKAYAPLGEITSVVKGRSYKSVELEESPTALVTLKSIDRNGGYKHDGLKPYSGPYKPEQVVKPGEIVVAQTDLTQGAEVVGRGVRVPKPAKYSTLVASLDLAIVRPMDKMPIEYLLGLLSSEGFRQHCRSHVTGTTVLHLAKDAIPTWSAPVVSPEEQERFSATAGALLARMDELSDESARIRSLRGVLIPELISGRVRVPVAEATA